MRSSLSRVGRIRPGLAVMLWLAAATPARAGQQATANRDARADTPATTRLSGRVVAADTSRPLRGAIVNVAPETARTPADLQGRSVTTDAKGRWTVADLQPGGFTVSASKGGYLTLGDCHSFMRGVHANS